jgi:hypothetical protein
VATGERQSTFPLAHFIRVANLRALSAWQASCRTVLKGVTQLLGPPGGTAYHYFRLWRNTTVWVHLYRGEREKPVIRLSSACSQAKLGLDFQAWIGGLLKGQPPTPGPKTLACGHAAP